MTAPAQVPVDTVKEWPEDIVRRLKQSWITSVEEVLAISATPGGLRSLAQHLGVSEGEAQRLVAIAERYVTPDVAKRVTEPPAEDYGLGALKPRSTKDTASDA
jgi:hypothetical protein